MKLISRFLLLTMMLVALTPNLTHARGLLGERYFDFSLGVTFPGDEAVEEIDDSILGIAHRHNVLTLTGPEFMCYVGI